MRVDIAARQRLVDNNRDRVLNQGISQIGQAVQQANEKKDPTALVEFAIKQLNDLNLTLKGEILNKIVSITDTVDKGKLTTDQYQQLQKLVEDVNGKMQVFEAIKEKIDAGQTILFPKDVTVNKHDIGTVDSLPPVTIANFPTPPVFPGPPKSQDVVVTALPPVIVSNLADLARQIEALQSVTIQSIKSLQTKFPESFSVSNEVKISEFNELLERIDETNKGLNMLLNKEGQTMDGPMKVEIVAEPVRMVPQPVTKFDLNPLRGEVTSTGVTVGNTTPTPLPGTSLAKRRSIIVFNNHATTTLYIGGANVANSGVGIGLPVLAQTYSPVIDAGANMVIYGIAASGSLTAITLEASNDYGTTSTTPGNI